MVAATTAAEVATTSAPHESLDPHGRPGARNADGAAAARTAELFTRYERTVSGLCKALLRDRAEAEDAAQQTFLSAHRALLNGSDPREPAAWLATIARNECWARIRSRMREPLPSDNLEGVAASGDPFAEAIRRADLAALWQAIESLPRQQRDALVLREFGGLSYEELAAALAVTSPAVESLLFRARTRLRTQLRAAYASLTGASWLEALARVFVGGGAPVAAKVAALGVGAAAITSGAVVAPQMLERHRRPAPVPARPAGSAKRPAAKHALAPVVTPVVARQVAPAPVTVKRVQAVVATTRSHEGESGRRRSESGSGSHERETPELETRPLQVVQTTRERSSEEPDGEVRGPRTSRPPTMGTSGESPHRDSGGGGDSEERGREDGHGGAATPTTTDPVATVPAPEGGDD
jgi:RNA polymerase sigma factor (sigma-70 family)